MFPVATGIFGRMIAMASCQFEHTTARTTPRGNFTLPFRSTSEAFSTSITSQRQAPLILSDQSPAPHSQP